MRLSKSFPILSKDFDFFSPLKKERNGRMRIRLLALQHLKEGKSVTSICNNLKVARERVYVWVNNFKKNGLEGLKERPGRGRKPLISREQEKQIISFVEASSKSQKGGRIMGNDVVKFIFENFNIRYGLSSTYHLLHKLGFNWITSRSIHPKTDLASQEMFKKNLSKCRIGNT
jgi:transposase